MLGPILFLIYINDIVSARTKLKFTMYADDTTLILADKNIDALHSTLTTELNLVHQWVNFNELKLNISKTNYIYIFFKIAISTNNIFPQLSLQEAISQVPHTKFFGVIVDEHLNWKQHIDHVSILELQKFVVYFTKLDTSWQPMLY